MLQADKNTVLSIKSKKKKGQKIVAVTAYDFPTAKVVSEAGIDIILVGDSLGMVLQGFKNTLPVTVDEVVYHTAMVARAEPNCLVVSDMPFQSYHISPQQAVENACRFVKEGNAEAVKLEGGRKRFQVLEAILDADIPVMAHLGLTPQSVHRLGGFRVQGKLKQKALEIIDDARRLEDMGVFSLVMESVPMELAQRVTKMLSIPVIGIGAGKFCDGQILVYHDLLGFTDVYLPKFVRKYADIYSQSLSGLKKYVDDVQQGAFPDDRESYHLKKDLDEFLK